MKRELTVYVVVLSSRNEDPPRSIQSQRITYLEGEVARVEARIDGLHEELDTLVQMMEHFMRR